VEVKRRDEAEQKGNHSSVLPQIPFAMTAARTHILTPRNVAQESTSINSPLLIRGQRRCGTVLVCSQTGNRRHTHARELTGSGLSGLSHRHDPAADGRGTTAQPLFLGASPRVLSPQHRSGGAREMPLSHASISGRGSVQQGQPCSRQARVLLRAVGRDVMSSPHRRTSLVLGGALPSPFPPSRGHLNED
jgi:hypothetical protein